MLSSIKVHNLTKTFRFPVRSEENSFWKNFFSPNFKQIDAVKDISFEVLPGESVAFIGPNGAGKSTTIKMLTGILYPTSGQIEICGVEPHKSRDNLAYNIGTVFGQRSQLVYNLPIYDSFFLFSKIYNIDETEFQKRYKKLTEIFALTDFINQPVRKLSLGQRMRAEVALSLLHKPKILFLDEPTIGLDVVAKVKLRETLNTINEVEGTTIFLTSHDAGDIEALCERTIIVNQGQIIVDQNTNEMQKNYFTYKEIDIELAEEVGDFFIEGVEIKSIAGNKVSLKVDLRNQSLGEIIKRIVDKYAIKDLDVSNPKLEEIITAIYKSHS